MFIQVHIGSSLLPEKGKARQRNAAGSSQILSNSFDIQQLQYSMASFAVKQNGLHQILSNQLFLNFQDVYIRLQFSLFYEH